VPARRDEPTSRAALGLEPVPHLSDERPLKPVTRDRSCELSAAGCVTNPGGYGPNGSGIVRANKDNAHYPGPGFADGRRPNHSRFRRTVS
jgi:hypothetical protein